MLSVCSYSFPVNCIGSNVISIGLSRKRLRKANCSYTSGRGLAGRVKPGLNSKRDGESSSRHAQAFDKLRLTDYVCKTPMLNSLVAGLWLAASIPNDIHVLVSSGSITASSHSRLAA